MFHKVFQISKCLNAFALAVVCSTLLLNGCVVEAAKDADKKSETVEKPSISSPAATYESKATIKIQPNSPADTVRVFYQKMREKKFREALFLTNLRPAIESLTEVELKDLQVDFDALAGQIPVEIAINGEIVTNNEATVTAKLPDNETNEIKLQEIKLRREKDVWIILTVDDEAEKVIKKEGKNYFFNLKVETHEEEAKAMLERIFKAQLVYSSQNGGIYGDISALLQSGFLPEDIKTTESTGYKFSIILSFDKKSYRASAEPAVYGKTGRLSYLLNIGENQKSIIKSQDKMGKPIKN